MGVTTSNSLTELFYIVEYSDSIMALGAFTALSFQAHRAPVPGAGQ